MKRAVALAEDFSRFAIACQQTGPIALSEGLEVFSADISCSRNPRSSTLRSEAQCLGDIAISAKITEGFPDVENQASLAGAEASNDRVAGSGTDDISFPAPNDVATDDELAKPLRSALERALPSRPRLR